MSRRTLTAALAASLGLFCSVHAFAYTAVYSFGDSLSDAGNLYNLTGGGDPQSPYSNGRFSNGAVWVQDLSVELGLPAVQASLSGGTDYAYGDAQTGATLVHPITPTTPPIDLPSQIAQFQAKHSTAPSSALYTLDIGANDIFQILGAGLSAADTKTALGQAVANTLNAAETLFSMGATSFLFYEVPDLGLTPYLRSLGPAAQAAGSALAAAFDTAVLNGLASFESGGVKIYDLQTYALLDEVVANPGVHGFTDVVDPCWTGTSTDPKSGTVCNTPDSYLFWDGVHPTAVAQSLVANAAFDALGGVPEPSTWAMMLLGFVGLGFAGYHRARAGRAALAA
jgi:phospholipase/lecithinase/hemolysin